MIRMIDFIISFLIFIFTIPVFAITYFFILIFDGKPVFYYSNRIGYLLKKTIVYKFRTMKNSELSQVTLKNDDRVTLIGKIIRKFKIDELPQFINIFKGQMRLVGPRPESYKYINQNNANFDYLSFTQPGIIDLVTLLFVNESNFLESEEYYVDHILPLKSKMHNKIYSDSRLSNTILPIFLTPISILFPNTVKKLILKYFIYYEYVDAEDLKIIKLFKK